MIEEVDNKARKDNLVCRRFLHSLRFASSISQIP